MAETFSAAVAQASAVDASIGGGPSAQVPLSDWLRRLAPPAEAAPAAPRPAARRRREEEALF